MEWVVITTAFMLGLLSSAHCVGMCGGIMGALTMAVPLEARKRRLVLLLTYNVGRIASYSFMGLLVGLFGQGFVELGGATWLRTVAGVLLIAMGLYLANWWRGLTYLETGGRYLWTYLQPLGKPLMPVNSAPKALLLGALWGWLPCGLVYSALVYAMSQGQALNAAALMLAFGVGTLPAVLTTGLAAQQFARLLQQRHIRWVFALLIIAFGVWTLLGASGHHAHHQGVTDHSTQDAIIPTDNHHPHHNHYQHLQSASSSVGNAE